MKANDISDELLEFREALRHTWNAHLRYSGDPMSVEVQESLTMVERGLFYGLVLLPTSRCDAIDLYRREPMPFIQVQPRLSGESHLNVQAAERTSFGVQWGVTQPVRMDGGTELQFIEFFDWDIYGWISLPLVKTRVVRCDSNPQMVGVDVLVKESDVSFVLMSGNSNEPNGSALTSEGK